MPQQENPISEQDHQTKFQKWLENLQQESWQLELLVSGFAIFLILGAYEPLKELQLTANYLSLSISRNFIINLPIMVLRLGWVFFLFNLLLHVLLRGLWISTIGLRYVSGDIDFDKLGFTERFRLLLEKRIGSFDRYIERLEKLCSVVFAFTFLTIFNFISFSLYFLIFGILVNALNYLGDWFLPFRIQQILEISLVLVYLFMGLVYMIDFLTMGWFKRKSWAIRWYPPIYRIMSGLTLSFIYRPIYYNLIDNRFGRWIGVLLVPYMLVMLVMFSLTFVTHEYFPEKYGEKITFNRDHYDDLRGPKRLISESSISSPYLNNGYLEVFIPYLPNADDPVLHVICPGFTPPKSTNIKTSIIIIGPGKIDDPSLKEKADSAFQCLRQLPRLYVNDSLFEQNDFLLFEHPNREERGLRTTLDVNYLPRGKHILKVEKQRLFSSKNASDSLIWRSTDDIVFWIE